VLTGRLEGGCKVVPWSPFREGGLELKKGRDVSVTGLQQRRTSVSTEKLNETENGEGEISSARLGAMRK